MSGVLRRWIDAGATRALSERRAFQVRAANTVALAFSLMSLPYVPLQYWMGARTAALITLISCFVYPLTLPLNHHGWLRTGRAVPLVGGTFMGWTFSGLMTPASQVHLVFFMIGLWAFVLYDARTEWKQLVAIQLAPVAGFVAVNMGWTLTMSGWSPTDDLVRTYAVIMPVTTMVLNSAFLFVFYWRNQANEARLEQIVRDLDSAHRRAQLGERSKAEFLAVMSHEIRTPLNRLLGAAELLKRSSLSGEQREWLRMLRQGGEELSHILGNILEYTDLDSGIAQRNESDVDVKKLLDESIRVASSAFRIPGLVLTLQLDPALPKRVRVDAGRVRIIVIELVKNALTFTSRGSVTVRAEWESGGGQEQVIRLIVEDTGCGIAPEAEQEIFDVFRQADQFASRRHGGVGLGLSLTKAAVRLLEGCIGFETQVGIGTRFEVSIPVGEACVGSDEVESDGSERRLLESYSLSPPRSVAPSIPPQPAVRSPSRGPESPRAREPGELPTVLVVDDQLPNRLILKKLVGPYVKRVILADNGAQALELWRSERPDLILMDINMPIMDGLEATKAIRLEEGPSWHVRIVAVTANALPEQRAEGLAAGLDGYLTKPARIGELREAIDACMGVSQEKASGVMPTNRPGVARAVNET